MDTRETGDVKTSIDTEAVLDGVNDALADPVHRKLLDSLRPRGTGAEQAHATLFPGVEQTEHDLMPLRHVVNTLKTILMLSEGSTVDGYLPDDYRRMGFYTFDQLLIAVQTILETFEQLYPQEYAIVLGESGETPLQHTQGFDMGSAGEEVVQF